MNAPEMEPAFWETIPRAAVAIALSVLALAGTSAQAQQAGAMNNSPDARPGAPSSAATCAGCHGARGEGGPAFPRLAGTGQAYLQAQLEAFANGSRQSAVMQPLVQKLTAGDRTALASYYSRLPAPVSAIDTSPALPSDTGVWLATRGRWANQVPACAQCHGPGGIGVGEHFPPLAGLPATYIAAQIAAWKAGTRPPGPLDLMADIAKKLSDREVEAVAAYYAQLGGGASAASAPSAAPPARAGQGAPKGGRP